ncbi:MAG: hypothetical protein IT363_03805 [Methanoregulaceae archaeon]|nr:hypothetical protein [Methanoregulaceae archaeon]
MLAAMLVVPLLAPPQLAMVARVYKPGLGKSYPRAYVVSADGSGFRAVSLPGQVVEQVQWSDGDVVYWVDGDAWLVHRGRTGRIGLDFDEERIPTLNMSETRMTSGDIIKWGEDYVTVFGRTHSLGLISSVRVGSEGWRLYFVERVTMIESRIWCADARTRAMRPILSSQDTLLDWHPDRQFVAFSPQRTDVPFEGQRVWANELWVGTLGGSATRLRLPTMELLDVEVKP